jgi:hypothetical protein
MVAISLVMEEDTIVGFLPSRERLFRYPDMAVKKYRKEQNVVFAREPV